jgi:hypothetical protein
MGTAIASNYTAHVDRGYLIAIVHTNSSPGLEVLPATASGMASNAGYVCPEDFTQRASLFTEAASCTNLICILIGCWGSMAATRSGNYCPCVCPSSPQQSKSIAIVNQLRIANISKD